MTEFLNCPFCGSIDIDAGNEENGLIVCFCTDCGAKSPQASSYEEAIKIWNKRTKKECLFLRKIIGMLNESKCFTKRIYKKIKTKNMA
jgi:Lar family restriction alleviation protein